MSAIIGGPTKIINVTGGVVQFGDSVFTSPIVPSKTSAGSGSFNTGGIVVTNNVLSGTNVFHSSFTDQPIVGNN